MDKQILPAHVERIPKDYDVCRGRRAKQRFLDLEGEIVQCGEGKQHIKELRRDHFTVPGR